MRAYTVYFDVDKMKMNAEIIEIVATNDEIFTEEINQILNSKGYDFFDYSDEIVILVDDQGFFKEGVPVFEIESTYGDVSNLAGKLVFVRNVENEFSVDIGNISYEEIFKLRNEMKIQFIGFTKGVS